jgi:multiple sugar transport system substrate-binding protein
MEAVCRQIKAIDPNCIPLGYDSEANWFITMTEQYKSGYTSATGNHYLFDNETNRAFVERFARWHSEGLMTTQELNGGYTSSLFVNQDPTLPKSYMSIGSSAGATHQRPDKVDGAYPFEVGITSIPQVDANNPKVISQGPSLVLLDTGDTQENIAAWLLMRFLTTDVELQAEFANASGYVPVLKSVTEISTFKEKLDNANGGDNIAYLSMKVCLEQEKYYYTSPAFNGSSTARDQVGALMKYCMENYTTHKNAGTIDKLIDEAFKNAINECESQL